MRGESFDSLHAVGFCDERGHLIIAGGVGGGGKLATNKNVTQALQSDGGDSAATFPQDIELLCAGKKVAQGTDAVLLCEIGNLVRISVTGEVEENPGGILSTGGVLIVKELQQRREDICIKNVLDLVRGLSDIGDDPTDLFADAAIGRGEEGTETRKSVAVDDDLCLTVVSAGDVAQDLEGGGLDRNGNGTGF